MPICAEVRSVHHSIMRTNMRTFHRILLASLLTLPLSMQAVHACDFCNCLAAINPWYNGASSVALHAMIQRAVHGGGTSGGFIKLSTVEHGGHDNDTATAPSVETRTTFELSGRWQIAPELMITTALPLVLIHSDDAEAQGVGDPRVMAYYVVHDSDQSSALLLGAGLALPLGTTDARAVDGDLLAANDQPGTRALTAMANVTAQIRLGGWSITGDLLGRLPFADGEGNRRGASMVVAGSVGHDIVRDNEHSLGLIGVGGLRCEAAKSDLLAGEHDPATGFVALYGQLGAQAVFGSVRIDAAAMIPITSHRPEESPQEEVRIVGGVRYQF